MLHASKITSTYPYKQIALVVVAEESVIVVLMATVLVITTSGSGNSDGCINSSGGGRKGSSHSKTIRHFHCLISQQRFLIGKKPGQAANYR